jgi:hypothetical protein
VTLGAIGKNVVRVRGRPLRALAAVGVVWVERAVIAINSVIYLDFMIFLRKLPTMLQKERYSRFAR